MASQKQDKLKALLEKSLRDVAKLSTALKGSKKSQALVNSLTKTLANALERHDECELAESLLADGSEKLKKAQRIAQLGFLDWNIPTNEMKWSDEIYTIWGFDRKKKPNLNATIAAIHPEDAAFVQENLEMAMQGTKEYNIDHRIVRPNGDIRWIQAQADLVRNKKGAPLNLLGTALDITERKLAEEALSKSEENLSLIYDTAGDVLFQLKVESRGYTFMSVNQTFCNATGIPAEDVVGKKVNEVIPEPSLSRVLKKYKEAIKLKKSISWEETTTFPTGERIGHVTIAPIFDDDGKCTHLIGSVHDITDLKDTEEKLRQNLILMEETQKIANMGVWKWDIAENDVTWSSTLYDIFGVDKDSYKGSLESYLSCVHEDDREQTQQTVYSVMQEKKPVTFEERIVRPNKEIRYLRSWAGYIADEKDKVTHLYGACMDITEKKKTELELEVAFNEVNRLKLQLERENVYLQEEIQLHSNFENMVFASPVFREMLNKVEQVAPLEASVLITGETGTGKELIARAIHNLSERKDRIMIKLNCAAIPAELVESELFGHEKGAFTGATDKKLGKFELADQGTIFLDEFGEMPLDMQVKLLRVLQEGEFERVGGTKTIKVDVRVIAATNRDLKKGIEDGNFRQDLFYRLNVFPIHIPPLRERSEDVPPLAELFINKYSTKHSKEVSFVSQEMIDALQVYEWPGNVRELENTVERAVITSIDGVLEFPEIGTTSGKPQKAASFTPQTLDEVERTYMMKVLQQSKWKIGGEDGAAHILGLRPSTLRDRMKKLDVKRPAKT